MDPQQLKERVQNLVPEAGLEENNQFPVFIIPPDKLHTVAEKLRSDADTAFDYLFCLTGVDLVKELGVVYHLNSTIHGHSLVLKVMTADRENPSFDSVTDIWKGAELLEREVYDLLGIRFNNHPDLRRIFLDENWAGYPLRKDYKDEVNIVDL